MRILASVTKASQKLDPGEDGSEVSQLEAQILGPPTCRYA